MSFEDITITRQFPVINGFVQLPHNLEKNRTNVSLDEVLTSDPSVSIVRMHGGTGGARTAGGKHGIQEWVEVCTELAACCTTPCDQAEDLKSLQTTNSSVPSWDNPPPGEGEWNSRS